MELIWEGKYDKDGKRVAPVRVALPFQTVETVNETAKDRQRALDLYKARPVTTYTWVHSIKAGRMVHVGAVDSPVSVGDVTNIVTELSAPSAPARTRPRPTASTSSAGISRSS